MAVADGFHVDSIGNLWLGSNRETFDATTRSEAPFYVYANGDMVANSGTFAGTLSSGISISAPVITGGSISGTSGSFTGSISGASGTFTGDLSGSDITGGTIDIGSGTFEVDSSGNLTATSATITGSITSTSGTIGGWTIGSTDLSAGNISIDSGGTISANYSATTGWKIEADGDAFFNDIDLRIAGAISANPTTGFTTLDIGTAKISEYDDRLWINAAEVMIWDGDSTASSTNPTLHLFGTYAQPGWYVDDGQVGRTKLYYTSGNANAFHTESDRAGIHIDSDIWFSNDSGSANEFIGKNSSGQLGWHTVSSASHGHTESDISDIGSHGHSYDNYSYWNLNLNGSAQIQSGNTVTFSSGTNTTAVRTGTSIRYDVSFPSLSIANTTSNNAAYAFVTAVSGHQITRTNTSSSTLSAAGWRVNSSGGYVGAPGVGATVWYSSLNSTSDETLKTDIADLTYGLDWINELTPISYRFQTRTVYVCENELGPTEYSNSDDICGHCESQNEIDLAFYNEQLDEFNNGNLEEEPVVPTLLTTGLVSKEVYWGNTKKNWGFSAQAIESSLPVNPDLQIVEDVEGPDGGTMKVLEYNQIIAPLVKAVQELSAKNDELQSRIEELEG
jgi:hypothetical protein